MKIIIFIITLIALLTELNSTDVTLNIKISLLDSSNSLSATGGNNGPPHDSLSGSGSLPPLNSSSGIDSKSGSGSGNNGGFISGSGSLPPPSASGSLPPLNSLSGIDSKSGSGSLSPPSASGSLPPLNSSSGIDSKSGSGSLPPPSASGSLPPPNSPPPSVSGNFGPSGSGNSLPPNSPPPSVSGNFGPSLSGGISPITSPSFTGGFINNPSISGSFLSMSGNMAPSTGTFVPIPPTSFNPYTSCPFINSTSICPYASNIFCSAKIQRVFDKVGCCFSCRICDSIAISSCPTTTFLRVCGFNETSFDPLMPCCQKCFPPIPPPSCNKAQKTEIPLCSSGVAPALNSSFGCPTCLPSDGRAGSCTTEKLASCSSTVASLRDCPPGQPPTRDPDSCCLNCKPVPMMIGSARNCDPTSKVAIENCINNIIPKLSTCRVGETRAFNNSNCCITCNMPVTFNIVTPPPTSSPHDKSSAASRCTRDEVSSCVDNMPTCGINDTPLNLPSQCCPSCTRPQSICSPNLVVSCVNTTRSCLTGETPSFVLGECCPTCVPAPPTFPTCTTPCDSSSFCMVLYQNSTLTATCSPVSTIELLFNSTDAAKQYQLSQYDKSTMRVFINELITRYCTGLSDVNVCNLFVAHNNNFDGEIVSISQLDDGTVSIILSLPTMQISSSSAPTTFKSKFYFMGVASSSASYSTLVTAAATDTYAAFGYSSTAAIVTAAVTTAPTTASPTSASSDGIISTSSSFNLIYVYAIVGAAGFLIIAAIYYFCFHNSKKSDQARLSNASLTTPQNFGANYIATQSNQIQFAQLTSPSNQFILGQSPYSGQTAPQQVTVQSPPQYYGESGMIAAPQNNYVVTQRPTTGFYQPQQVMMVQPQSQYFAAPQIRTNMMVNNQEGHNLLSPVNQGGNNYASYTPAVDGSFNGNPVSYT